MNLLLLLDMAATGRGDEVVVDAPDGRLTASELLDGAWGAAGTVGDASALAYVGTNGLAFPLGLFAAAAARVPFSPLNYRLGEEQLDELLRRLGTPLVLADETHRHGLAARGHRVLGAGALLAAAGAGAPTGDVPMDGEDTAVLLFTSGTTAAPKAAVLRHRHLTSYVIGTVEFGAADPDDAVLVSVPPYHVAGLANLLSNLYAGRRIVYLRQFDAEAWVEAVRRERITNAMVVPTMLARIADVLERDGEGVPSLRSLSYGGARTPAAVLQRVMALLPDVALTNAYGLTETSSTVAVLGPDDHRAARDGDPVAVQRLSSAGKVLPTVEVEVRDEQGPVAPGEPGEIWVRGEQVSGEYAGMAAPVESPATSATAEVGSPATSATAEIESLATSATAEVDEDGWFPTRDRGWLDADGYLFIQGRSDDTIIRGGENIAPAEIEEVLLRHPAIRECAVVGVPHEAWGQQIAAVVVLHDGASLDAAGVQELARRSLRGSKTPGVVAFADALPYTDTGKLLRREVQDALTNGNVRAGNQREDR